MDASVGGVASRELLQQGEPDGPQTTAATRGMPIMQIVAIARKRKWALICSVFGALLVGFVATLLMTPLYTASATLEIQRETENFTNVEGAERTDQASLDPEYYQTQYGLLRARSLADRVVVDLGLQDNASFFALFSSSIANKWFSSGKIIPGASNRGERIRRAGDLILHDVVVQPERLSRLVKISFTSPNAAFSKRIIDAWSAHFIQATLERRYETTSYARKFLEDRLSQLRIRIDESERQLVNYAAAQKIINLPGDSRSTGAGQPTPERPLIADDLSMLNQELARATADRIQAESRRKSSGSTVAEALQDQGIAAMRSRRAEFAGQYAQMLQQFEPEYPPARALLSQIHQLDRSLATEEGRIRATLEQSYKTSVLREQELVTRVNALKSSMLDLRRRSIQYNVLQREVDTSRQLYDALLQRYKEIGIAGGVGVNNISVVDAAEMPNSPSSPRPVINLALALLVGLGLGVGIALLLEQLSDNVDDPAEIPEMLAIPLLGTVPKVADSPIMALEDPKEPLSEAYFSLQTNLTFTTDHGFPKSLAVTSSRPAEGKSISTYAIARLLARPQRRVILIDADMRSPSVHQILDIGNGAGLSNYLSGSNDLADLIRRTPQEGLFAITAGPQPPSAADLLSGDRLEALIAELLKQFDHVIFDAPPVMGLADAPLITSRVEGTVFVIEAHATGKSVARVAISRLQAANARLLGAVVTKFDTKRAHYGYGYNYGYGYGYGPRKSGALQPG